MKIGVLVIGICVLVATACAADAPDAYTQTQPDQTIAQSTTTSMAVTASETEDPSFESEDSEASESASTTSPASEREEPSTDKAIAPYRGTPVDPSTQFAPRLALKIDNAPAALPQEGLQEADIVFEELVEGGLTRFLAVFHSQVPEFVGPIRSGRSSDIPLLMPFDGALFGWSGSNWAFRRLLDTVAIKDVGLYENPANYWRNNDRPSPSNLWARSTQLLEQFEGEVFPFEQLWPFQDSTDSNARAGKKVGGVQINWGSTDVSFHWVDEQKTWKRVQNGKQHLALTTTGDEVEVTAENVVVQFTKYLLTNEIDGNGARIPLAQLSEGSGTAWILKNGEITEGRWIKPNITVHTQFVDETGKSIPMTPGATWILLAPRDTATIIDIDD
tara:strand:- start:1157 stop:2320 length:1164 start_codon:yes stop_codon:yes gene_type:complete